MTWGEFRLWAKARHSVELPVDAHKYWVAIWSYNRDGSLGIGSGHWAVYGVRQRRRFSCWLRLQATGLISDRDRAAILDEAEGYADGWIVKTHRGQWWLSQTDAEAQAVELARQGFVALRCGE